MSLSAILYTLCLILVINMVVLLSILETIWYHFQSLLKWMT